MEVDHSAAETWLYNASDVLLIHASLALSLAVAVVILAAVIYRVVLWYLRRGDGELQAAERQLLDVVRAEFGTATTAALEEVRALLEESTRTSAKQLRRVEQRLDTLISETHDLRQQHHAIETSVKTTREDLRAVKAGLADLSLRHDPRPGSGPH